MKSIFPGSFVTFDAMKPGTAFMYRDDSEQIQFAMKAHYPAPKKDYAIRFIKGSDAKPTSVLLSLNPGFARARTLLSIDGLEIAPVDRYSFVGPSELDDNPIESGWLGVAGKRSILTFTIQPPADQKIGYIDLETGELFDELPIAVWYQSWRITLPNKSDSELIFEMKAM